MKELIEYVYDRALDSAMDAGATTLTTRNDLRQAVLALEKRTGGDEYTQEDVMALFSKLFENGRVPTDSSMSSHNSSGSSGSSGSSIGGGYTTHDTEEYGSASVGAGDSLGGLDSMMSQQSCTGSPVNQPNSHTSGKCEKCHGPCTCYSENRAEMMEIKRQFADRIEAMNAEYKARNDGPAAYLQIENFSVCPFMYALQCLQKVKFHI